MDKRYQVNIRLDRDLVSEIDRLAGEDAVDRSEMARRLLGHGLAARRMRRALDEYRAGNVTTWRAAQMAGVSLYEMLDRIHEEGIPFDLDPEILDRVGVLTGTPSAIHEEPAPYGSAEGMRTSDKTDDASGIMDLRAQFRPSAVTTLFVGESSPTGGTHFYRADSNLFRATREAFALAFGESVVSDGPRFLREFQDRGCWLVDLVDRPVNRLSDDKREALVLRGVASLAQAVANAQPDHVVAIKATIAGEVRSAMDAAGSRADLLALPFPVRQWRAAYVRELAEALRRWASLQRVGEPVTTTSVRDRVERRP